MEKQQILIDDDEEINRVILKEIFQEDYEIIEAVDGRDAIYKIQSRHNLVLILLDVIMPVMDGFELIRELKKSSIYSRIPIIVITASEERKNEIKALQLGAVDVVTKPYDPLIVSQRVKNVMKLSETEWLQMEMQLMRNRMR